MGTFRGLVTVALLILFVGLLLWAWSNKRHGDFEAASRLPLDDDDRPPATNNKTEQDS